MPGLPEIRVRRRFLAFHPSLECQPRLIEGNAGLTPQALEPGSGLGHGAEKNGGDVVFASGAVGEFDQTVGSSLQTQGLVDGAGNLGIGDHARETVGTKQKGVSFEDLVFLRIHFDVFRMTQRASEDGLEVALGSLFAR